MNNMINQIQNVLQDRIHKQKGALWRPFTQTQRHRFKDQNLQRLWPLRQGIPLFLRSVLIFVDESRAQDQNIALTERDPLLLRTGFELCSGEAVRCPGIVR